MNLTPQQREQARLSLLRWLTTSPTYGVTTGLLLQYLRTEGFRSLTLEDVTAELQYLVDKEFVAAQPKAISPENKMWRITAEGRDALAEAGNE